MTATMMHFAESFNGKFRDECLNENWLLGLPDAQERIEAFRIEYNQGTVLSSLGDRTPGGVRACACYASGAFGALGSASTNRPCDD
jgi:hypothetical protein